MTTNRILLSAGLAGPLVFVATVVFGGMVNTDYSHLEQAISELSQRGAPHAGLVGAGFAVAAFLNGVFGYGVVRIASKAERRLAETGKLLMAYSIIAVLLAVVFPMDPVGTPLTVSGQMHLGLVTVSALILIAALAEGGVVLRLRVKGFGAYSYASILLMLAGGVVSGTAFVRHLPILGLGERITQATYLAWIFVFAVLLLRGLDHAVPAPADRTVPWNVR